MDNVPEVYGAICAVMSDIGQTGIAKGRKNQQQGYSFRGIDDVYNELNSLLSKHSLIMVPRILTREVTERQTQKGGVLFYVTVEAEFDLISAKDGSKHTVRTLGEAMDSADKATNKAMSAAYKYAAMMVFCIPTEGDNDADAVTHEIKPKRQAGWNEAGTERTAYSLRQEKVWDDFMVELRECTTIPMVTKLALAWSAKVEKDKWPEPWKEELRTAMAEHRDAIKNTPAPDEDVFPGDRPSNAYADNFSAG
jgi:hypothetical protein